MAYDLSLAEIVRELLNQQTHYKIVEKRMFGGLAFMVNDKMCVNVSGDKLMCRFDAGNEDEVSKRRGYQPLYMKGRLLKGYCYVDKSGLTSVDDYRYWIQLCLDFNQRAVSSKQSKSKGA